jgi:hypothetical protein
VELIKVSMQNLLLVVTIVILLSSCRHKDTVTSENISDSAKSNSILCDDDCMTKKSSAELKCKMLPEELQQRRETVIASLKKKVLKKTEMENGYSFQFSGDDATVSELEEFIKTEKECCEFLQMDIDVRGDQGESVLHIIGPEGVKKFINAELGM